MTIFPHEKIKVIFYGMDLDKEPVDFNDEQFHTLIYENKLKYPKLLKEFTFQLNGTFPYSELLERIIIRAKISRSVKTVNPDFSVIEFKNESHEVIKQGLRTKLKPHEFKKLESIGREIKTKISVRAIGP
jgi:hypothetical protein